MFTPGGTVLIRIQESRNVDYKIGRKNNSMMNQAVGMQHEGNLENYNVQ